MFKRITFILLCAFSASTLSAQTLTADFEDLNLGTDSFYYGQDWAGQYTTQGLTLQIQYDTAGGFESWTGFAASTKTDTSTAGFLNQGSSFAGSGNGGSSAYGVYFSQTNDTVNFPNDIELPGFYITNNTYAALSMRNGDAFAKKFGGPSGNDPDYFRVRFQGFDASSNLTGEVVFYLADYRSSNNAQDYILKDWEMVDLSPLGSIRKFAIVFESSDTGQFGINTPKYFCLDDFQLSLSTGIGLPQIDRQISLYPNPASDVLHLEVKDDFTEIESLRIYDVSGSLMLEEEFIQSNMQIDVSSLPKGLYLLHAVGQHEFSHRFIKQ